MLLSNFFTQLAKQLIQFCAGYRLQQIILHSKLYGRFQIIKVGVSRQHNRPQQRILLFTDADKFNAVQLWHTDIGDDQLRQRSLLQQLQRFIAA